MVIFKFCLRVSRRQLELLVAPRRIGFPAAAGGTVPVELPRLESAVLAMVARQALRMAVYEIAHELQVVAPFRGRDQELRLEQLVQAEQGLVADRKSTRLNSSHLVISYAVFCLKTKKTTHT